MKRPPRIHHPTSEPWRFFGRKNELSLLNTALAGGPPSLVAFIGDGGQGKTAIVQHWLHSLQDFLPSPDAVFLWSFYRGPDADLCLRHLYAYAFGLDHPPELSASFCVDRLLPLLRSERWAIILDGTEVAQYDSGSWTGRFINPEMGRLLEELSTEATPGVTVITTRFALPTLQQRSLARIISLDQLDQQSATELLMDLGVKGTAQDLENTASLAGFHAKTVELLGTYLATYHGGDAAQAAQIMAEGNSSRPPGKEGAVARVLELHRRALPSEMADIVSLATAFRIPVSRIELAKYLASDSVYNLLHENWQKDYQPFRNRLEGWFDPALRKLLELRLLESVDPGPVIDSHPLVRRAFEMTGSAGEAGDSALARAGFLRSRPDRRCPESLQETGQELELFHAYCDANLWSEADRTFLFLNNPKHRLLAPGLEKEMLLRFFPDKNPRNIPYWSAFSRYRSLAIALEMLGEYQEAIGVYPREDSPLRGDSLLALGQIEPMLITHRISGPWNNLWQAYRCHALALAGNHSEAISLAQSFLPMDIYEWFHVFESLWHTGHTHLIDPMSLNIQPGQKEHRWSDLARRRMKADYLQANQPALSLDEEYQELIEAYDQAGLPLERVLTRVRYACYIAKKGQGQSFAQLLSTARNLAQSHHMEPLLRQINLIPHPVPR